MGKYQALLVAADGGWVTDHSRDSVEEVQEALADQGSRWYFYPFHAVITDRGRVTRDTQRIVDAAEPFEHLKGSTVRSFSQVIAGTPERELEAILW
jgi:hypothetical protein